MVEVFAEASFGHGRGDVAEVEVAGCAGVDLTEDVWEDDELAGGFAPFYVHLC